MPNEPSSAFAGAAVFVGDVFCSALQAESATNNGITKRGDLMGADPTTHIRQPRLRQPSPVRLDIRARRGDVGQPRATAVPLLVSTAWLGEQLDGNLEKWRVEGRSTVCGSEARGATRSASVISWRFRVRSLFVLVAEREVPNQPRFGRATPLPKELVGSLVPDHAARVIHPFRDR